MDKGVKRIFARLLLAAMPIMLLAIAIPICLSKAPMRYYDEEYAWFYQNKEYSQRHKDYCRVLIMGDSVAKASWLPDELSADTYNFSLGGVNSHRRIL